MMLNANIDLLTHNNDKVACKDLLRPSYQFPNTHYKESNSS